MTKKIILILSLVTIFVLGMGVILSPSETCYEYCARIYAGNPAAITACQARCR